MNRLRSRSRELLLLLFAAALLALMLFGLETSQGRTLSTEMLYIIGGFVGVYAIAHVAIAILAPYADQVMLPVVALLNAIGLVVIYRLDLAERPGYGPLAERQMLWSLVGVGLMVLTLIVVRDHKSLSRYSYLLGLVGLILSLIHI